LSGGAKALGETDLAVSIGGLGGVGVAYAIEVVIDSDGLAVSDEYPLVGSGVPPIEIAGEGDFLIDGGSGIRRNEGDAD